MSCVPEQGYSPRTPRFYRAEVINLVAQDWCVMGRFDDPGDWFMPTRKFGLEGTSRVGIQYALGAVEICEPISSLGIQPYCTKALARTPRFECITRGKDRNREFYDSPITGVAEITQWLRAKKRLPNYRTQAICADQNGPTLRTPV